jgi:hypothetical protein
VDRVIMEKVSLKSSFVRDLVLTDDKYKTIVVSKMKLSVLVTKFQIIKQDFKQTLQLLLILTIQVFNAHSVSEAIPQKELT